MKASLISSKCRQTCPEMLDLSMSVCKIKVETRNRIRVWIFGPEEPR